MKKIEVFLISIGLMTLSALGCFFSVVWAFNLVSFLLVLLLVNYLVISLSKEATSNLLDTYDKGANKHLPAWMDKFMYIFIVIAMVTCGHIFIGVVTVIVGNIDIHLREEAKKRLETKSQN